MQGCIPKKRVCYTSDSVTRYVLELPSRSLHPPCSHTSARVLHGADVLEVDTTSKMLERGTTQDTPFSQGHEEKLACVVDLPSGLGFKCPRLWAPPACRSSSHTLRVPSPPAMRSWHMAKASKVLVDVTGRKQHVSSARRRDCAHAKGESVKHLKNDWFFNKQNRWPFICHGANRSIFVQCLPPNPRTIYKADRFLQRS